MDRHLRCERGLTLRGAGACAATVVLGAAIEPHRADELVSVPDAPNADVRSAIRLALRVEL